MKEYILAWDVAQKQDRTAIQLWRRTPQIIEGATDRIFEYLDLVYQREMDAVPYPEQCKIVSNFIGSEKLKNNTDVVIDATGIGQAVVDIMREYKVEPIPIVFTNGATMTEKYQDRQSRFGSGAFGSMRVLQELCVPKVDMIHAAKVMMEQDRVRIAPNVAGADAFTKQLSGFTGKINVHGNMQYGNDAETQHDDWVSCFIMACWYSKYTGTYKKEKTIHKDGEQNYDWNPLEDFSW